MTKENIIDHMIPPDQTCCGDLKQPTHVNITLVEVNDGKWLWLKIDKIDRTSQFVDNFSFDQRVCMVP